MIYIHILINIPFKHHLLNYFNLEYFFIKSFINLILAISIINNIIIIINYLKIHY